MLTRTLSVFLALALLVVITLALGCSSSEEIIINPQREPGTMRGTVTSIVGDTPVANAKIHIISTPFVGGTEEETWSAVTYTDEAGWYDYVVPHGNIVVVVSLDGFKRPDPQLWSLSPDGSGRLNFELIPGTNGEQIDPRVHDPFCLLCHYAFEVPDPDTDGKEAWPPEGTGTGDED